jgi:hypothetical protein
VNFYSHVAIASLFSEELGLAFGAMLPDLASLVGAKPPKTSCPHIRRGYALHHATDRAFHELEPFRHASRTESQRLLSLGLSRGTAVAAAHVGLELVLDDALAEDEPTQALFRTTLAAAAPQMLCQSLEWGSDAHAAQFETLRQRVWSLAMEQLPLDGTTLAERLCRTLERRPKLAVRAGDRELLQCWAAELRLRYSPIWPGVVMGVLRALDEANLHTCPSLSRPLRFRRAWSSEV